MLKQKILSEKYVLELYRIFEEKNWETQELGKYSVFNRFCSRLAELDNDEQRELILELTHQFLWVQSKNYEDYLLKVLKKLFSSHEWKRDKGKNIFICPLLAKKDFGKIKSGTSLAYLCQSILLRTFPEFQEEQIQICTTPEGLKSCMDNIGVLILIDDFIGSGGTALECLGYLTFLKEKNISTYLVSLVAQKDGVDLIKAQHVPVFAAEIRKKAITDAYPKREAEEKLKIMKSIGKCIHANKKYYLGYNDSESLVAMIKTPNNTFPVYWHEQENKTLAPFVRRRNIQVIGDKHD